MYVGISEGCLKFCLVLPEDCRARWQTVEHFYDSILCTFENKTGWA